MRQDSPRWEEINPSPFEHERDGLRILAAYLPDADPYHVWANVEFVAADGSINEVDALVLTPSGLYVLELKHWHGKITGDGVQWVRQMPNGRLTPEDNPYILANRKAKRLAGLIRFYARQQRRQDEAPYVGAAVFLHAKTTMAHLDEIGRQHVYGPDDNLSELPSLREFLLAEPRRTDWLVDGKRGRRIVELVRGAKIRPSVQNRRIDQLILYPQPFAEGAGWQDFLAGHALDKTLVRRVRFYLTGRAPSAEIPVIRRAAEREFRLLQGIHHPGIAHALDLVDHAWGPAVIFEYDQDSVRLDRWLAERSGKLTIAQRLHLVQDLAEIIDYAHSRRLAHRALRPRAVFVADPDKPQPTLVVTDWQTGGRLAGTSTMTRVGGATDPAGLELFFDSEVRQYQAPEAIGQPEPSGSQLDVFSLGALTYWIFTGRPPTATPEELVDAVRDGGLNLAAAADGMPNTLVMLVYDATRGDPAQRLRDVRAFRERLDAVWEELTAPEPEPVIDPLEARKKDVLDGGLTVLRRLGTGATALALLVEQRTGDTTRELVLKVARDEQHADRLRAEARALAGLQRHWQVAALIAELAVGGRTALLLESAGPRTLAEELRGGKLALDLLERYGRDLMDIVTFLDGQGVWHRDIKPANLAARPRPKDKQPHLCIFDFSLAAAPADQLSAGTPGYLDPFLGPPRRLRYDGAAERFAAAVTLYEMATGTLPRWGEGANPAAVSDEVTLDPATFDPAIADRLVAFFARALARDARRRFDTVDEMADAWRAVFADLDGPRPEPVPAGPAPAALTAQSPLDAVGLTPRARSALERLGVHTAGDLLEYPPSSLTRAPGVPNATRREILAHARTLRTRLTAVPATPRAADQPPARGVEALCATLLPKRSTRNTKEIDALLVLLGQAPGADGRFLRWPTQSETAKATGQAQPQISHWLRGRVTTWVKNTDLSTVRDEIVALLDARGGVMAAGELAEALIAARGSFTPEPRRTAQAVGLVRAAVEAELTRGGDARLDISRFRTGGTVLVGREPDDPAATTTAADLLAYAMRLGRRAADLAAADPLPTPQRTVSELRAIPVPEGAPACGDQRLLQLAAAASGDRAAVNPQGQLYPVDLPAERALKLAVGSVIGQRLTADHLRSRVRARFPRAQELPARPALDRLLAGCEVPLTWDPEQRIYLPRQASGGTSLSWSRTQPTQFGGPADDTEADAKLAEVIARGGFLAVLCPLRRLAAARRRLLATLRVREVDVTTLLLDRLRATGFPWEKIVAADTGTPGDPDFRSLTDLVAHHVVPALRETLAAPEPILLTEAAPLARYGQMGLLAELADQARPRPAARLLLVPARRPEPAMLDRAQIPLPSPTTQSLWLRSAWIDRAPADAPLPT